jgi:hypothetical protein
MSITAILQGAAEGKRLAAAPDPDYCLAKLWPVRDPSFPLLQYIDPYGHAVFNGLQMPQILRELDVLISQASTTEQRDVLGSIRELAVTCQNRPQRLLHFWGD